MDRARRIALVGMVVSALLATMKLTVGWFSHSSSLRADGFESCADVLASGVLLVGLTLAARPADEDHPYGHGRIEILTGLLLGFLLLTAGLIIAWHGITGAADVNRIPEAYARWPLLISIAVKSALMVIKYRHGKNLGSSSIKADAANDAIDMLSGIVALGALELTLRFPQRFPHADHYGAFAIGLIVMGTALRVLHESSLHLMDTMPDDNMMRDIRRVAMEVPDVKGVEKCFARKTGLQYHVDLHLEVDAEITVRQSHEIARRVKNKIRMELPWVADVLVHVEPWSRSKQVLSAGL